MKSHKNFILFLTLIFLVQILAGCASSPDAAKTPTDNNSSSQVDQTSNNSQELTVDHDTCEGCGKCAMMDSEHFSINQEKSTVISEENLDSQKLQQAIEICPEDSISLSGVQ